MIHWDIVSSILVAYGIIVAFEYLIKLKFSAPQQPQIATLSPETRRILEQKLMEQYGGQYEDNAVAAIGRGVPKPKNIGFRA